MAAGQYCQHAHERYGRSYRLCRGEPDGRYVTVGIIYGTSYADTGLQPDTRYRWRVVARVRGTEGIPSPIVATSTKPNE